MPSRIANEIDHSRAASEELRLAHGLERVSGEHKRHPASTSVIPLTASARPANSTCEGAWPLVRAGS